MKSNTKKIFIFSSSLHYMFACLLAEELDGPIEGYYYESMSNSLKKYEAIDKVLNFPLSKIPYQELMKKEISEPYELFFANRYHDYEVDIFNKLAKKAVSVNLYEEGFSMYLTHIPFNKLTNDDNIKLKIKNIVRSVLDRRQSHIYLNQIDNIYTILENVHKVKKNKVYYINKFYSLKEKTIETLGNKSCIILSQWFVEHNLIKEDDYISYISELIINLKKDYNTIYYKEHPRDSISMTNKILNKNSILKQLYYPFNEIPIELYLAKNSIDVYGFWSSAMFYAKKVFNTKIVSLFKDISKKFPSKNMESMYQDAKPKLDELYIEEYSSVDIGVKK